MKSKRKKFWILLIVLSVSLLVGLQIFRQFNLEKERKIRVRLREAVKRKYPDKVKAMRERYGIKPLKEKKDGKESVSGRPDVILIHGLDEPGKIWMNLTPALLDAGLNVLLMTYPNDQPVVDSAEFFFEELVLLGERGSKTISIVAHSMGGLVTREMLTSPKLAYHQNVLNGRVPAAAQLIMVGTPNGGSEMARFRIFTEFRDQLTNFFSENYSWLHGILDGAGEAGIDLIPGSPFLETLNSRPHPKDTDMLVIAGVMSNWQTEDIDKFIHSIKGRLPNSTHETTDKVGALLSDMARGMGDGLVSVESARLAGVPMKIVQGTHLTMIRNISGSSDRIPPAVPIVVEALKK